MLRIRWIAGVVGAVALVGTLSTSGHAHEAATDGKPTAQGATGKYQVVSSGTRQFEWDTDKGMGWIKVLVEAHTLGAPGAEVAEVFFPPGYEGQPHPHGLEIIYVLDGVLDHIVEGKSHILNPGMVGLVQAPDLTVHKVVSDQGVRALIIWPLGQEIKGLDGMREKPL